MNQKQTRLGKKPFFGTTYDRPQYNAIKGNIQRIELHRGCPWNHEYCYEPQINEDFPIPELTRNKVQILDMNPLCRANVLDTIIELGSLRVNNRVIYYEAVCGFDFRLLTQEIADALKAARFVRPRLAWDGPLNEQYKIKNAVKIFLKAGYRNRDLMLFMIVNWRIPYVDCLLKLDIMKVWGVKVCDCCYDGGYKYAVPEHWTADELKSIRAKSRKHNQLVNFGLDPEIKPA